MHDQPNAAEDERFDAVWREWLGDGPLIAAAVHAGHDVRPEVAEHLAISEADRLREEDPYTDAWAAVAGTWIVGARSRFEVDLNRPRDRAVYRTPADAWGLKVWRHEPPEDLVTGSLAEYDAFYTHLHEILSEAARRHGRFVVLDLHSYNHRRGGAGAPAADPEANPQVNVGTGTMDRDRWAPVVDRFMKDLRAFGFPGGRLDVRENVKFRGGHVSRRIHESFPGTGCALAVEFKKFFMDEWTGEPDPAMMAAIAEALRVTVPGILEEIDRL